jgi:hypothetical protein
MRIFLYYLFINNHYEQWKNVNGRVFHKLYYVVVMNIKMQNIIMYYNA